jgi:hypothetical protein
MLYFVSSRLKRRQAPLLRTRNAPSDKAKLLICLIQSFYLRLLAASLTETAVLEVLERVLELDIVAARHLICRAR